MLKSNLVAANAVARSLRTGPGSITVEWAPHVDSVRSAQFGGVTGRLLIGA